MKFIKMARVCFGGASKSAPQQRSLVPHCPVLPGVSPHPADRQAPAKRDAPRRYRESAPPTLPPLPFQYELRFFAKVQEERNAEANLLCKSPGTRDVLSARDRQLQAYLLARSVDGRPSSPELQDALTRANNTVEETRSTLRHGRGNVTLELQSGKNDSFHRVKASRDVLQAFERENGPLTAEETAGIAAAVGAGNCGEFAMLAGVVHGRRQPEGEFVEQVHHALRDHAWCRIKTASGLSLTVDAWRDGPAVESIDAARSPGWARVYDRLETTHAADALAAMHHGYSQLAPLLSGPIELERQRLQQASVKPSPLRVYPPKPVIAKSFATRVKRKFDQLPAAEQLLYQLGAVGMARDKGIKTASAVARAANQVIDQVRDLRRPMTLKERGTSAASNL